MSGESLRLMLLCLICAASSPEKHFYRTTDTHRRLSDSRLRPQGVLTVTTILLEPYVFLDVDSTSKPIYQGYVIDLLAEIGRLAGFEYRVVTVYDGQYGKRRKDGTWDGMIGEILRGEADLSAAPLFITAPRLQYVDFSEPFLEVRASALVRRPTDGTSLDFHSVEELLNKPWYTYGTLNRGIIPKSFRSTNNSAYRSMYSAMQNTFLSLSDTNVAGIERVRQGNYAYILPDVIGDYVSRRAPCDLIMIDRFLFRRGYGIAMRKGSRHLRPINRAIAELRGNGFLTRLYEKWWSRGAGCAQTGRVFSVDVYTGVTSSIYGHGRIALLAFCSATLRLLII